MKDVVKAHTNEIISDIKRINGLVLEIPDGVLSVEDRNKMVRKLIQLVEAQLIQLKLYFP